MRITYFSHLTAKDVAKVDYNWNKHKSFTILFTSVAPIIMYYMFQFNILISFSIPTILIKHTLDSKFV